MILMKVFQKRLPVRLIIHFEATCSMPIVTNVFAGNNNLQASHFEPTQFACYACIAREVDTRTHFQPEEDKLA